MSSKVGVRSSSVIKGTVEEPRQPGRVAISGQSVQIHFFKRLRKRAALMRNASSIAH